MVNDDEVGSGEERGQFGWHVFQRNQGQQGKDPVEGNLCVGGWEKNKH